MRRPRVLLIVLFLLAPLLSGSAASSSASEATDEFDFLNRANDARAQAGLAPLKMSSALVDYSRSHSARMRDAGNIFHTEDLAVVANQRVPRWQRAGENVGVGGSVESLHTALMNSPGHRANILGDYNYVGMGVVHVSGKMYITQFFTKTPADLEIAPGVNTSPVGSLDLVSRSVDLATVTGWAIDPDTASAIDVHVYVDGRFGGSATAGGSRPDVGAIFPNHGKNHGFSFNIVPGPGTHNICAYAINTGSGGNALLGCKSIDMNPTPFGSFDAIARVAGGITVNGWAIDPDTTSSVDIHVYVNGGFAGSGRATVERPDLATFFPDYGARHGFSIPIPLGAGSHNVCVYALNASGAGNNTGLGCKSVSVDPNSFGSIDFAQRTASGLRLGGWAIDPDTPSPIGVHVYVDGTFGGSFIASSYRGDLAGLFPSWGGGRGFDLTVNTSPTAHTICVYAIDAAGGGTNTALGCKAV